MQAKRLIIIDTVCYVVFVLSCVWERESMGERARRARAHRPQNYQWHVKSTWRITVILRSPNAKLPMTHAPGLIFL